MLHVRKPKGATAGSIAEVASTVAAAVTIAADSTGDNQSSVSSGQTRLIIGLSNHYGSESGIPRFRSYFGSMPSFIKFTDSFLQNKANLIVDNYQMYESYAQELGEPVYHKLSYLGNLLVDLVKKGKIDRKQIYNVADIAYGGKKINKQMATVFSSGGMSIEDIAVGNDVLNEAIQMGVGTYLEF